MTLLIIRCVSAFLSGCLIGSIIRGIFANRNLDRAGDAHTKTATELSSVRQSESLLAATIGKQAQEKNLHLQKIDSLEHRCNQLENDRRLLADQASVRESLLTSAKARITQLEFERKKKKKVKTS